MQGPMAAENYGTLKEAGLKEAWDMAAGQEPEQEPTTEVVAENLAA